jgi:exodeoxyribonuclease VII small subunit
MDSTDDLEISFEEAFQRLEQTVGTLENGGLSIDDLVAHFERGMALVALCRQRLNVAQARLTRLVRDESGDETMTESMEEDNS